MSETPLVIRYPKGYIIDEERATCPECDTPLDFVGIFVEGTEEAPPVDAEGCLLTDNSSAIMACHSCHRMFWRSLPPGRLIVEDGDQFTVIRKLET